MGEIDQIETKSLDFLTELYVLYKDKDSKGLDMYEIGRRAKCDQAETEYRVYCRTFIQCRCDQTRWIIGQSVFNS